MKFIKENLNALLTILFLVLIGILLLVDPATFGITIIKVAGVLFAALGIFDLVKYFRSEPAEAAKGLGFSSGVTMISIGCFCIFGSGWFKDAFPVLAVLYGLFQILLGFRKAQRTVDDIRMKKPLWYLKAISAAISLLFGLIIVLNPGMTFMSIWVFTGITLIIEGIFDAVALFFAAEKSVNDPAAGKKEAETEKTD